MRNLKFNLACLVVLVVFICAMLAKADWEQRVEELQVLNQITNEELELQKAKVKQLEADLKLADKKIVELESQPK